MGVKGAGQLLGKLDGVLGLVLTGIIVPMCSAINSPLSDSSRMATPLFAMYAKAGLALLAMQKGDQSAAG